MIEPVFRFAPSPNGALHLGHAYSALLNLAMARANDGRMLLRIEDIDTRRCTPELEAQMLRDLEWIGFEWDMEPIRQSQRFDLYRHALDTLRDADLVYPSTLSRGDINRIVEAHESEGRLWPKDPEGGALFPGRDYEEDTRSGQAVAWRLDVKAAEAQQGEGLYWQEDGAGPDGETGVIQADAGAWGDCVLVRKDTPTSYHLASVLDDAASGVTHIVRGHDLFFATSVHVLLQGLFGFFQPRYFHHGLIMVDETRKLSKSKGDISLGALRDAGLQRSDIVAMIGLSSD